MDAVTIIQLQLKGKQPTMQLSDDRVITVPSEIIIKYKLKEEQKISVDTVEAIILESEVWLCKDAALRFLRNKNKTRHEMKMHLEKKAFSSEIIDQVEQFLSENALIDDLAYAESFISNALAKGKGTQYVKDYLNRKGVANDLTSKYMNVYSEEITEYERCKSYIEKYLVNETITEKLLMKLSRKLIAQGYPDEIIEEALEPYAHFDGFDNE